MAKILILDIETAPNLAFVWKTWKENISTDQLIEPSFIMSYSAKWLGEEEIFYAENRHKDDSELIKNLCSLLSEADIVVAHGADRFDVPVIHGRAAVHGFMPPSPFKTIDTLAAAKKVFRLPMYNLEFLCRLFGCSEKNPHSEFPGFKLWLECIRQNDAAWAALKKYNIQDIISLEDLYIAMRPWIPGHPNIANFNESDKITCSKCGSENIKKRGFYHATTMKYQRYRCQECGAWSRSRYTARDASEQRHMLRSTN